METDPSFWAIFGEATKTSLGFFWKSGWAFVLTALILTGIFGALGILPGSSRVVSDIVQFRVDYTFWLNLVFIAAAAILVRLYVLDRRKHGAMHHKMPGDGPLKTVAAVIAMAILGVGFVAFVVTGGIVAR